MTEHKLVIVGGSDAGKSKIAIQFVYDTNDSTYDPTSEEGFRKLVVIDGVTCLLDINDTAGQEEYSALRDMDMASGDGFLCVFAVNSKKSFEGVKACVEQIRRIKDNTNVPMILVGHTVHGVNHREVDSEAAQSYADGHSMPYIEVCAETRHRIEEAFYLLVREIQKHTTSGTISVATKRQSHCALC